MPRTNVNPVETKYRKFNDWLRGELSRRKMKQKELAEYLGIEQPTLSCRLNGTIKWDFWDVLEVLDLFETSLEEIL